MASQMAEDLTVQLVLKFDISSLNKTMLSVRNREASTHDTEIEEEKERDHGNHVTRDEMRDGR